MRTMDGMEAYRNFLRSDFWKELSLRKRNSIWKCELCGSRKFLQSHHRFYRGYWYDTRLEDLQVLCRKCHRAEHGIVSWPPFMIFRDDVVFSAILHRCHCLHAGICGGKLLRERDERFLDNALRLYPATPTDGCVKFKVGIVREFNRVMKNVRIAAEGLEELQG